MPKRLTLFLLLPVVLISYWSTAQNVNDVNQFLNTSLNGTARFNGMAGAFGALGGDITAISTNPAGSSVFLHSEFGGTLSFANNALKANYFGTSNTSENRDLNLEQAGIVFVFNNTDPEGAWTRVSTAINSFRVYNFDEKATVEGSAPRGIDQYFVHYAEGLPFNNLPLYDGETIEEVYTYLGESNGFAAQQAFLGYQSYIINPLSFDDDNTGYSSNVFYDRVNHQLKLINSGKHRKTTFNVSGLYKNRLHIGANINYHKLDYTQNHRLKENEQDPSSPVYNIEFENELLSYGDGYSAQLGLILKLTSLRLGFTYDSPQWLTLFDETRQSVSAYHIEEGLIVNEKIAPNTTNIYTAYQLQLPSKTTLSGAYILGSKGLFSVDYSYQNTAQTRLSIPGGSAYLDALTDELGNVNQPQHTLRFGGEYRFSGISVRGGYMEKNAPLKNNALQTSAFTFGVGFDFGVSSLNLSLVQLEHNQQFTLYSEGLTSPYTLSNQSTKVSLSYSLKL